MKNHNREIDEMIKKALSKEEAGYYDELYEQSLLESVGELYKGKFKWFNIYNVVISLVALFFTVYCLIQFLEVEETNLLIRWGAGMIVSIMMASMMKMWTWNQMDKNSLLREIKRLEIQVANLASKQDK